MMISAFLLCSGLLAAEPAAAVTTDDRATYEAAKAEAGRDASAHVKLALWCEQHGLTAERAKHLALAVLNDPKNAMARSLMGLVQVEGAWRRPAEVETKLKADAARAAVVAEYEQRRARTPHTADAQWKLALWCEENGLKAESVAHFWAVIRLEPSREAAWKRLGYKKHRGRWATDAQLAAEKVERTLQDKADKQWKPLLEKWRDWLGEKGKHRDQAEEKLANVVDPRAVPMVWVVFARGNTDRQLVAVRLLGQIDAPAASRDLALLAVFSPAPEVRRRAAEVLVRRDVRDFGELLIGFLADPIRFQVRSVGGPGSRGELFIEGKTADVKRLYSAPRTPSVAVGANDVVGYDANGLPLIAHPFSVIGTVSAANGVVSVPNPTAVAQRLSDLLVHSGMGAAGSDALSKAVAHQAAPLVIGRPTDPLRGYAIATQGMTEIPIGVMILQAQAAALSAQRKLAADVAAIERNNGMVQELNERVSALLRGSTGQDFGADREAWRKWFVDLLGYAPQPQTASPDKPLLVEDVPLGLPPQATPVTVVGPSTVVAEIRYHSCFGRGTPVRTLDGLRPIETIAPGDQVLTQDARSGALSYQPVLRAVHNPPNQTLAIKLGDETIVATGIHRFWKAGHGWVMARDLKPGDPVRTIGGVATVDAVDTAPVQPVFNLEVASGQSFFVGGHGALVHDNSLVQAVAEPFDAPPKLKTAEVTP